jgi:excisionase family DNA binding protein
MHMNSINDKWLTIDDLAAYLKMGRTKLYTMAQKGDIPGNKIGSQWRFDREEIDAWVKSGQAAKPEKKSIGKS